MMFRVILFIFCTQLTSSYVADKCVDGVHNVITLNSDRDLPILVEDVVVHFYNDDMTPACHMGKVNVQIPGNAIISGGTITLKKNLKYDDAKVHFTFIKDVWHICENGGGTSIFVPNFICTPPLTKCLNSSIAKLNFLKKLDKVGTYEAVDITDSAIEIGELPWLLNFLGLVKGVYKMKLLLKAHENELMSLDVPAINVGF